MKHWISSLLLVVAPALAFAAQPTVAPKKSTTAQTTKKTSTVKKTAAPSKNTARKAAVAGAGVAAAAAVSTRALNADELALADRVYTGRIACELGQYVTVKSDEKNPGHFLVSGNGFNFHMSPVGTSTGVVRLEDTKAGAVWLQIANKSMLMNQKQGKRLADECMSTEQLQVAEAIKKNPPPSLLDAPSK